MDNRKKLKGFDFNENPYEEEARRLWGDETVDRSRRKIEGMTDKEKESLSEGMDRIFSGLADLMGEDPASEKVQEKIISMYAYFNENFGDYTPEAFRFLGQMYVDDSRFTENIDRYGNGLSLFLRDAMGIFAENSR